MRGVAQDNRYDLRRMAEFDVGAAFTRADIYELIHVPEEKRHGAWNRGHREWEGEMFIFATVGVGTTSGFDYPNALHPDGSMTWTGVGSSHSGQVPAPRS